MKTKAEIEAELLPEGLPPEDAQKWPKERTGALNVYTCDKCRGAMVVVLLDWGTTPFMVDCRATVMPAGVKRDRYCRGTMKSHFYRVAPLWAAHLSHGWYRPADTGPGMLDVLDDLTRKAKRHGASAEAVEAGKRETIGHVERGGLLLRELTDAEQSEWWLRLGARIMREGGDVGGRGGSGRFA